jgi:hypothetical protein
MDQAVNACGGHERGIARPEVIESELDSNRFEFVQYDQDAVMVTDNAALGQVQSQQSRLGGGGAEYGCHRPNEARGYELVGGSVERQRDIARSLNSYGESFVK